MKKTLIAAAVAAMTVSGGAWAACTADIAMGGNKITGLTMTSDTTQSEAATQSYVDARTRLEVSKISGGRVNGIYGAQAYCNDLDATGTADGTANYLGWRVPTQEEIVMGFTDTINTARVQTFNTGAYQADQTAPTIPASQMLFTATPLSFATRPAYAGTNTSFDLNPDYWIGFSFVGTKVPLGRNGPAYAVCVR